MKSKVYGQHLVTDTLVRHLKGHINGNPRKALALSFHGWTGTGKNYVSQIVAETLYVKSMGSKYVLWIIPAVDFPHSDADPTTIASYKDKLRRKIKEAVTACPRALIIIDEMEKMPPGLIDVLKPYLNFHDNVEGVDYRKAIFFLLSNNAATTIVKKVLDLLKAGKPREYIQLKDLEDSVQLQTLNDESNGLWHSELITSGLLTASIPFLPLERKHVEQCIKDAFKSLPWKASDEKVKEIADQLTYFSDDTQVFSTTGCKRIYDKVQLIMNDV
ncbi:torsin-1A-like isoform X2 [Dreissena polymorpha]|nr:torsin-1A-like isoform X2 [Dreissena polymorpha]XP_052255511.1 torsin-1A-like isoform X2 [Dreissena polymorpha]XP_052255512.1 torsin-1A-like isoform X2 [Dreissena polymorpha]